MRIKIGKLPKMLGFRPLFSDFSHKSDKIGFFREIFRKSDKCLRSRSHGIEACSGRVRFLKNTKDKVNFFCKIRSQRSVFLKNTEKIFRLASLAIILGAVKLDH